MQTSRPSLFMREDTFLGACEALGEDFGFNPLWLRIAFGGVVLWSPLVALAAYVAMAAAVAVSRFLFPNRAAASATVDAVATPARSNDEGEMTLAEAA